MISRWAPSAGQFPGGPGGSSGFRLVLGQPDQEKGRPGLAVAQDDALRDRLADDLDGAFEELVRTYQDRLFSFAVRLTARREDAEEVAQDAFVRAYR
ncbi:MAG TPA: sigma factor, partial [Thermoanaerobaculia bacterium]|nr:sigma factor [Thermoanaerobaculia bacterium]